MASEELSNLCHSVGHLTVSDQDVFSFHDTNFHNEYTIRLTCMRDEGMLTDVILKSGNVSVRCHKLALAAASPYFYQVFKPDDSPSTLELSGISASVLAAIIDFIYTTKIEIQADLVKDLAKSCEQVQLKSLKNACDQYISEKIHPSNAMGLMMFAQTHKLEATQAAAEKCLLTAPSEVLRLALDAEYQELSQDALLQWIDKDDLNVDTEDTVFQIVERWVGADESRNNESCIEQILSRVRLALCTPQFLVRHVRKSPLICFKKFQEYFDEAMAFSLLKHTDMECQDMESDRTKARKYITNKNKIVLIGGISDGVANQQCWFLEGNDQTWKDHSTLPQAQQQFPKHFRACAVDSGIILTGRCDQSYTKVTNSCWFYSTKDNKWTSLPPMSQARCLHGMCATGNEVYVCGGYTGTSLNSVEKLDGTRRQWVTITPMKHAVHFCHAFYISGDIYVVSAHQKKTQKFNTGTNAWQVMADVPSQNMRSSMVNIGADIFVVAGYQGSTSMCYDTRTDTWTNIQLPKQVHMFGCALEYNGKIVLSGGGSEGQLQKCLSTAEEYDPGNKQWSDSTFVLPKPLGGHVIVKL